MTPTIEPGDVVLIDQNLTSRRRPPAGRLFAMNEQPVTGKDGCRLQRIELSGRTLVLNADNTDKSKSRTRSFSVTGKNLADILVGEVVWAGRSWEAGIGHRLSRKLRAYEFRW